MNLSAVSDFKDWFYIWSKELLLKISFFTEIDDLKDVTTTSKLVFSHDVRL